MCTPPVGEQPARGPGGARCIGGVSSSLALVGNRRTCRLDRNGQSKGVMLAPWSSQGRTDGAIATAGRVPLRGTGADRSAVVTKAL